MTLLTVKEVAAVLRVSPQTVYKMVGRGELPAYRIGSGWRFDADKIALMHSPTVRNAKPACGHAVR